MAAGFDPISSVILDAFRVATGNGPEILPSTFGEGPNASGGYAHATAFREPGNPDAVGHSIGFGTGGSRGKADAPWWKPGDWLSGEAGQGHFKDAAGDKAYGLIAEGQALKTSVDWGAKPGEEGAYGGLDWGGPDGALGVKVTNKTAQLNAQASLFNAGVTAGTRGTALDENVHLGIAPIGPGGALRGHYGDTDNDLNPELGFGADVGPISFDYRTEDPLYLLANSLSLGHINRSSGGADPLKPTNWTRRARDSMSDLWSHFTD